MSVANPADGSSAHAPVLEADNTAMVGQASSPSVVDLLLRWGHSQRMRPELKCSCGEKAGGCKNRHRDPNSHVGGGGDGAQGKASRRKWLSSWNLRNLSGDPPSLEPGGVRSFPSPRNSTWKGPVAGKALSGLSRGPWSVRRGSGQASDSHRGPSGT